jgi:hypothetical protein
VRLTLRAVQLPPLVAAEELSGRLEPPLATWILLIGPEELSGFDGLLLSGERILGPSEVRIHTL